MVVFRPHQQTEGLRGHMSPGARVSETVGWQQSSLRWIMEVAIVPKAAISRDVSGSVGGSLGEGFHEGQGVTKLWT